MAASKSSLPPSFGKYFKTTIKAQALMNPEGRICELDRGSYERELVYTCHPTYKGINGTAWDEMNWSQARLWDQAQTDSTMRIARQNLRGLNLKPGDEHSIYAQDLLNDRERPDDSTTDGKPLEVLKLGFEQCKREWLYLVSEKPVAKKANQPRRSDRLMVKGG